MSKDEALAFIKTMPRRGETVTFESDTAYKILQVRMIRARNLCPDEFQKRWNEAHND